MERQERLLFDGRHTPQNISLYSYCFGAAFGGCLAIAYYSETISQLGLFFAALALFHELEYMMTALIQPDIISLDGQYFCERLEINVLTIVISTYIVF